MGIRFVCPNGHKLNVKTELAGKRAICPDCGAKLVVPSARMAPSESSMHNLPTQAPPEVASPTELPAIPQGFGVQGSDSPARNPEPQTLIPPTSLPEDLAALPRVSFVRRRHQTPIIVTILLVFTIVLLVGVLIWVIQRNSGAETIEPQSLRIPVAVSCERS